MEFKFNGRDLRLSATKEIKEGKVVVIVGLHEEGEYLKEEIIEITGINYCCPCCGQVVFNGGERFEVQPNNYLSNDKQLVLKLVGYCSKGVYNQLNIAIAINIVPAT